MLEAVSFFFIFAAWQDISFRLGLLEAVSFFFIFAALTYNNLS